MFHPNMPCIKKSWKRRLTLLCALAVAGALAAAIMIWVERP